MGRAARHVDTQEAGRIVGRNPRYLVQLARAGKIPGAFKVGSAPTSPWRFTLDGLELWKARTTEPHHPVAGQDAATERLIAAHRDEWLSYIAEETSRLATEGAA